MHQIACFITGGMMALLFDMLGTGCLGDCHETERWWETLLFSVILGIAAVPLLFFLLFPFWFLTLPLLIIVTAVLAFYTFRKFRHIKDHGPVVYATPYERATLDAVDIENMFASSELEIPEQTDSTIGRSGQNEL
jgi:hypothetical protein